MLASAVDHVVFISGGSKRWHLLLSSQESPAHISLRVMKKDNMQTSDLKSKKDIVTIEFYIQLHEPVRKFRFEK